MSRLLTLETKIKDSIREASFAQDELSNPKEVSNVLALLEQAHCWLEILQEQKGLKSKEGEILQPHLGEAK
ncbi:hypothetical protein T190115A13A_80222 [Tenacibaculum sp. 190524A02b]|uniref:Uncharacterized protein n=1 Tax=Tenacibaculum vairaonense TaxID=3137860 RepID=A0ABP1FKL0_9FLAO